MLNYFKAFIGTYLGEEGQGMVEYALIIALIAILLVTVLLGVRGELSTVFTNIGNALKSTPN